MSTEKSPAEATPANITTGDAPPAPTASTSPDSSQTPDADAAREKAALLLQRNVRGKQTRQRQKGKISADSRWTDTLKSADAHTSEQRASEGKNDVSDRWQRSLRATAALREGRGIHDGDVSESDDSVDSDGHAAAENEKGKQAIGVKSKQLEEQHWLEMIDGKHRYGSNLKHYHAKWQESDTTDNFFRWLDHGEGKELSLPECEREQLEKERIQYLSAEQRLNYFCKIDRSDGKLKWWKSGEPVDTTANKWADAGHGQGIVPKDQAPTEEQADARLSGSETSSISSSDSEAQDAAHYTGADSKVKSRNPLKRLADKFTASSLSDRLLRKTVQKNTWIYVSDLDFNLFVALKKTGSFQHSSFLSGGRVTSAGVLTVSNGQIKSLSPLSGHYRSSIEHYKCFLQHLEEMGADMSKVKIRKAEFQLWGLEKYAAISSSGRSKKKKQHVQEDEASTAAKEGNTAAHRSAIDSFKRDLLHGRAARKEHIEKGTDQPTPTEEERKADGAAESTGSAGPAGSKEVDEAEERKKSEKEEKDKAKKEEHGATTTASTGALMNGSSHPHSSTQEPTTTNDRPPLESKSTPTSPTSSIDMAADPGSPPPMALGAVVGSA